MKVGKLKEILSTLDDNLDCYTEFCEPGGKIRWVYESTITEDNQPDSGELCDLPVGTKYVLFNSEH